MSDLPPVRDLAQGRSRETAIRRDAEGRWSNAGVPITHTLLCAAFDRWLVPAPDGSGRFCLSNDINWAYVEIDGPPRFVRRVETLADGRLSLALSDGRDVEVDPKTLRQDAAGALYCDVPTEDGHSKLTARFDRAAMMQLADRLGEDSEGVYLEVGDARVRPPVVADPISAIQGAS